MTEDNDSNAIKNYYWASVLYDRLRADSHYSIPTPARDCLIDQIAHRDVEWCQNATTNDLVDALIHDGFTRLKDYTDRELLCRYFDEDMYYDESHGLGWFHENVTDNLSSIELMKLIEDKPTLEYMVDIGIADKRDIINIFNITI